MIYVNSLKFINLFICFSIKRKNENKLSFPKIKILKNYRYHKYYLISCIIKKKFKFFNTETYH